MDHSLVIVTSAHHKIGLGHVMRELAIAEKASKMGWKVTFITDRDLAFKIIKNQGYPVYLVAFSDHRKIRDLICLCQASHMIFDVHESSFPVLEPYSKIKPTILLVSPVGCPFEVYGKAVIKIGCSMELWDKKDYFSSRHGVIPVHSGRSWSVFRSEFQGDTGTNTFRNAIGVIICHGGSDPQHLTMKCLKALKHCTDIYDVIVLIGQGFDDGEAIIEYCGNLQHNCRTLIGCTDVAQKMRESSLALINGGNIRYELCLTGTPFLAMGITERQREFTQQIEALGAGKDLGLGSALSEEEIAKAIDQWMKDGYRRQEMHDRMIKLFDMQGADRILSLLTC